MGDLRQLGLPEAAAWSLTTGTAGKILVLVGIAAFLLSALAGVLEARKPGLKGFTIGFFALGSAALLGSMVCLGFLFGYDQFQYEYVRARAAADSDLKYKIAGIWAGQQGSFMLWGVCSALFGLLAIKATGQYRRWFTVAYSVFLGFICAILAYETPFKIIPELIQNGAVFVPPDGVGLTPALQNYWVVIHPPAIFLGFGSLTVLACWALAAMLVGDVQSWVRPVRPWAILAASTLGLGLCLGGFWAYETLGWGGFWAWDPVENVSFVPWLFSIAFFHGLIVQAAKGKWAWSNLLLGTLPFLFFVYGTFLTRSGVFGESSVHSFVSMDRMAYRLLLGFLGLSLVGFLALWFTRGRKVCAPFAAATDGGISRENVYRSGVLVLSGISLATAIGMSLPAVSVLATGRQQVAMEADYHMVLSWLFPPLMLLMAAGPFVSWKRMNLATLNNRLFGILCVSLGLCGIALFVMRDPRWGVHHAATDTASMPFGLKAPLLPWITFLLFLCTIAAIGNAWRMVEVWKRSKMQLGGFLTHFGVAVLLAGMILSRGLERKEQGYVIPGMPTRLLDYTITYKGHTKLSTEKGIYDRDNKVLFDVESATDKFEARPGLYYTVGEDGNEKSMVWPHIHRQFSHDTYFALFEPITAVWKEPQTLKPGETKTHENVTVTYKSFEMEGQPGQAGTRFKANLTVQADGETYNVAPFLQMSERGALPEIVPINRDLSIVMPRINAGDQSAMFQVLLSQPAYPVELFYKPMTAFVWGGTGIMVLGGFFAAYARRVRRRELTAETVVADPANTETPEDAPVPVAQS